MPITLKTVGEENMVKTITYQVDEQLHRAFKMLSVEKGVTMTQLLSEAMRDMLRKHGKRV
jgi:hypothetical protein